MKQNLLTVQCFAVTLALVAGISAAYAVEPKDAITNIVSGENAQAQAAPALSDPTDPQEKHHGLSFLNPLNWFKKSDNQQAMQNQPGEDPISSDPQGNPAASDPQADPAASDPQ